MFYLAIESSCDETSLAILEVEEPLRFHDKNFYTKTNQIRVISSIISSQIQTHAQYGGVVPEVGARLHAEQIHGLFQVVLSQALDKLQIDQIRFYRQLETIFVTSEPGLMSALRVGIEFAKSLQFYIAKEFEQKVELKFVNHLQGHVASCFYEVENYPSQLRCQPLDRGNLIKLVGGNSPLEGEGTARFPCDILSVGWQAKPDGVVKSDAIQNDFKSDGTQNGDAVVAATNIPNTSHSGTGSFAPLKMTSYLDNQVFPHLHLVISGGNTQIRLLKSWTDWQIVGQTIDDAAGECFDKAARMVGIAYPGGATLSKIAGEQYANPLDLPIAMLQSKDLNISLSGLKTAVRYKIQKAGIADLILDQPLTASQIEMLKNHKSLDNDPKLQFVKQICVSTQFAIIEQIKRKVDLAIKRHEPKSIGVSGGVSANGILINQIQNLQSVQNLAIPTVFVPDWLLTGDNAVMIGLAGLLDGNIMLKTAPTFTNLSN
jgi:glycoprotease/Kae1 family metallohydrolase